MINVSAIITLIASLIPLLRDYFTKNKGVNTVTGGFLGAFGVLAFQALEQNQGTIDQFVTYLSNQGTYGVLAGALVVGLRAAVYFLKAR